MAITENRDIKIVVTDEKDLYSKFSPENEFNDSVKSYIRSKITDESNTKGISLTVISPKPVDEEKFREAAANWVSGEKAKFRAKEKNTYFTLIGLLIFGSIMLVLCLSLQKNIYELQYSLMPIMGSLALSKATGILVIDIPVIHAQRWILNEMNKYNVIKFEYGSDHNDLSCEADQGRQEPEKE